MENPRELDRKYYNTNYGFYTINSNGYRQKAIWKDCCSSVKTTGEVTVYIPKEWCDVYDHAEQLVKDWISLVNKALNTKLVYQGIHTIWEEAKDSVVIGDHTGYGVAHSYNHWVDWTLAERNKLHASIYLDEFYLVTIPESSSRQFTYKVFTLLRYLWSTSFVPIVKKSLAIYKELDYSPNKALTAILLGHVDNSYDSDYSFYDEQLRYVYSYGFAGISKHGQLRQNLSLSVRENATFDWLVQSEEWKKLEKFLLSKESKQN